MVRKWAALAAGGAAIALVAGCTSGGGAAPGTATAAASTPAGAVQAALTAAVRDKSVDVTGILTTPAGSGTVTGRARFGAADAISVTQTVAGTSVTVILTGRTLYLNIPQLASELGGKSWARLDLPSPTSATESPQGPALATFGALVDVAQNADPRTAIAELLAAGDLSRVGTATVDGVTAVHYHGKIMQDSDLSDAQALKYLSSTEIEQLQQLAQNEGMTGATVDLWVGPDGLPVRTALGVASTQGDLYLRLDFTGWGSAPAITAPPAGQVATIDGLLSPVTPTAG